MKKTILAAILLAVLSSSSVFAGTVFNSNKIGTVTVNTTANTEVAPDVAEISFAVKTSDDKSLHAATTLNKEILDKVYAELKLMLDEKNGDYIKTSDFSANPIYSYQNSKKIFERYEVSNKVVVHTKSIDKVGKMIDNAISAGATNVDNLSFSVSNYEIYCNSLIATATKKAKNRAEAVAESLSTSVLGINNISTSCSTNNYNPPRFYMAKNMISDVAAESTALGGTIISNGVIKVNASVNATFNVK